MADDPAARPSSTERALEGRVALAITVAVVAISFAAIFFRKAAPTHPLVAAGVRLAIATVVLAPFTLRALRRGALRREVVLAGVVAGIAYAVHFGTWVTSLTLTNVAASVTLVTATPLILSLVALATGRDRPERRHFAAIALAIVGLSAIGGADLASRDALFGDLLAFIGAAAMAAYMLVVRRLGASLAVWAFSGIATLVGACALLGTALAIDVPIVVPTVEAGVYIALAALVPQLVGHTLLTWSLRHARPTVVGIATVGEPVGSTLLAYVWLDEAVGPLVLIGCGITLVAVVTAMWRRDNH